MHAETGSPRQKILFAALDLLRRRGPGATSIREVARHGRAPLGSTYHYFPGGKPQLLTEAIRWAAASVARELEQALQAGPEAGFETFCALWRQVLLGSDCQAGCPVLAVAVEGDPAPEMAPVLDAAADGFSVWEYRLARALAPRMAAPDEAGALAALIVAAVEGAIAMCRARRDIAPFDRVTGQLQRVLQQALAP